MTQTDARCACQDKQASVQYAVLHLLIQINEVTTANMFVLSPGAFDCAVTSCMCSVSDFLRADQVLMVAV